MIQTPDAEKTPFTKKGCTNGGFAENYIVAKIELYNDGKKGGDHADLIRWAKDKGHNVGVMAGILSAPPEPPSTQETTAEAAALAAMAKARARSGGGGSSSTD